MLDKSEWISSARLTSRFALGAFSLTLIVLLSLSYYFQWLIKIDHQFYDQQIRWLDTDPPEDVVVVAIDTVTQVQTRLMSTQYEQLIKKTKFGR